MTTAEVIRAAMQLSSVEREHLAYALLDSIEGAGERATRLTTLRAEVQQGFDDLAQGRYVDVADADLDDLVADIGRRAAQRVDAEHAG
ncbi:hypothetical protein [Nocardioides sp. BYT-33-1]|uniref:hypothetical protein n=1 Tax=Nocardioides sp. BYT-33-1 TaxID=3416952 RepID=UPI003F52A5ED